MIKAVVVMSGGQDSTTCLGWALDRLTDGDRDTIEAIHFVYGQKHSVETQVSEEICRHLDVPMKRVHLDFLPSLVESALTSDGDVDQKHPANSSLPASFVPNRNALFLTLAHAYAQKVKAGAIVTGVCQTDYSGYPDCREGFIKKLNRVLNLGSDSGVKILTPLMHLTKAETFALADKVGVLDLVIDKSHTCYNGKRSYHDWGRGCGQCPSCRLRQKGYEEYAKSRR